MKHEINGTEYEVTDSGAVFLGNAQVLVPAQGLDVLRDIHDLYEHIEIESVSGDSPGDPLAAEFHKAVESADPDAVAALDTTEALTCGAINKDTKDVCHAKPHHEGRHHAWLPAPADWGGGEDFFWDDEPQPRTLYWEGFNVTELFNQELNGKGPWVKVKHSHTLEEMLFNREKAEGALKSAVVGSGAYQRLLAQAALAWFDEYEPEWGDWKHGDLVRHEDGRTGLVVLLYGAIHHTLVSAELVRGKSSVLNVLVGQVNAGPLKGWHRI